MDDMDLPPSMDSEEEGEYEDEDESAVMRDENGNDIEGVSNKLTVEKLEKVCLEASEIENGEVSTLIPR
jgi:hypothetical protein